MAFIPQTLLLGHHGTEGALRAEELSFQVAVPGQSRVLHLLVVPDFWAGMQGDDWLNNASTRDVFARYVEGMLEKDAAQQVAALEARCAERGLANIWETRGDEGMQDFEERIANCHSAFELEDGTRA